MRALRILSLFFFISLTSSSSERKPPRVISILSWRGRRELTLIISVSFSEKESFFSAPCDIGCAIVMIHPKAITTYLEKNFCIMPPLLRKNYFPHLPFALSVSKGFKIFATKYLVKKKKFVNNQLSKDVLYLSTLNPSTSSQPSPKAMAGTAGRTG